LALLSSDETLKILRKYHLPVVESYLADSPKKAVKLSKKLGYPVVFKIDSPDVIHKSDHGGVITNVKDMTDAEVSFYKIIENTLEVNKNAKINGVLIQKQLKGRELIMGMKRDAQFGPVIIFGVGGVFVEILKDVSRRIAPLTKKDAKDMIEEIHSKRILDDFRGDKAVDKKQLVDILLKLSKLTIKEKEIEEIDFNPVISNSRISLIVDARIITK
jgi:acetate---CoA ligase (ADP-forming) subunit beta